MNEQLKTIQNIEVKFKARKSGIAAGIFLVFAGILLEVACILAFREEGSDGIIATILLTLFFCGPIIILGICATFSYFASKKNLGNLVAEYGEEKLITHIKQSTLGIYPAAYPGQDVYFTNKLIIDPGMAIIDYKKISMIYKHINKSQKTNSMYISIAFVLLDGGTYHLCGNPTDEQITKIMQLCCLQNPNILMGDTPQNREMHKTNVNKYKSGQIVIPKVSLETTDAENEESKQIADAVFTKKEYRGKVIPVPWEYTPEGSQYIAGKNLKCIGLFFAIGFLVMMPLTERVMFNPSNKTYETISDEKRTELLTDGYKEARIEGQYLRRFFHRNFDAVDWVNRNVYVFADETAVDGYFGIAAVGDWKYYCGEDWSGFAIFYKGEATSMMLDVEDGYYEVPIIDGMDICGVYGIPTEASLMEEQMTKWVIYTMFGLFAFIGFLMFVIGYSMEKKYKKLK